MKLNFMRVHVGLFCSVVGDRYIGLWRWTCGADIYVFGVEKVNSQGTINYAIKHLTSDII